MVFDVVFVIDAHLFCICSLTDSPDSEQDSSGGISFELMPSELLLASCIVIILCLFGLLFSSSVGDRPRLLPVFLLIPTESCESVLVDFCGP